MVCNGWEFSFHQQHLIHTLSSAQTILLNSISFRDYFRLFEHQVHDCAQRCLNHMKTVALCVHYTGRS